MVAGDTVLLPPGTEVTTEPLTPSDVQQIITQGTQGTQGIPNRNVADNTIVEGVNLKDMFGVNVNFEATKESIENEIKNLLGDKGKSLMDRKSTRKGKKIIE